jgi:hypothetical protein
VKKHLSQRSPVMSKKSVHSTLMEIVNRQRTKATPLGDSVACSMLRAVYMDGHTNVSALSGFLSARCGWTLAANISIKQSRTADEGWVGRGGDWQLFTLSTSLLLVVTRVLEP